MKDGLMGKGGRGEANMDWKGRKGEGRKVERMQKQPLSHDDPRKKKERREERVQAPPSPSPLFFHLFCIAQK